MSVAIRTGGEPCGPGSFVVPSRSSPGAVWTVFYRTSDVSWCACPRHENTGRCWHVEQVALAIEVEVRESFAQSTPESRAAAAARLAQIAQEFSA